MIDLGPMAFKHPCPELKQKHQITLLEHYFNRLQNVLEKK